MAIFKRSFSLFLVLILMFSMVPVVSQAEEEPQTQVDSGDITVEGTNSVGTLLSEELQEYQEADETAGGYNVVGLTIEDGVATAEFRTLEAAILIVGIYTEDGMQLLVSGKAEVQPEDSKVSIPLEGQMPQYFRASAYLVDIYDYSPLCTSYETPMYTQQMQELVNSTANDYDSDRVLILDDGTDNNFMVYKPMVVVIEKPSGMSVQFETDGEKTTYTVKNPTDQVTALKEGDVFSIPDDTGELILSKVESVSVQETGVTVVGEGVAIEEAFSHVKIEANATTQDASVDETKLSDNVELEDDGSQFKFHIERTLEDPNGLLSSSFEAIVTLRLDADFCYYEVEGEEYSRFTLDLYNQEEIAVSGKIEVPFELGTINIPMFFGLQFKCPITFVPSFSGKINCTTTGTQTLGFMFERGTLFKNFTSLSTCPSFDVKVEGEGSFFVGLKFEPQIQLANEKILKFGISATAGLDIAVKETVLEASNHAPEVKHSCDTCYEASVKFKGYASLELCALNNVKDYVILDVPSKELGKMYNSLTFLQQGWGECPYKEFRITLKVEDANGKLVTGANVESSNGESWGNTNQNGVLIVYLPTGNYIAKASHGDVLGTNTFTVDSAGCVVITLGKDSWNAIKELNPDSVLDVGVVASGTCGEILIWKLDNQGTLTISGNGEMKDWSSAKEVPWYNKRTAIKNVIIQHGVTTIGDYAFNYCREMKSVKISSSVTTIGERAFDTCSGLTTVTIPNSVTIINYAAFTYCSSLTSVTIGEGVTYLGESAFSYCTGLSTVMIPDSVTYIGDFAFRYCTDLKSIIFEGNAPVICSDSFSRGVIASAYYPSGDSTWTSAKRKNYGGMLTWIAYDSTASVTATTKKLAVRTVFGGEYDTEKTDNYSLKTASFSGLVAGEEYALLAMVSLEADDPLAADNLLAIDQGQAGEDGTLVFEYVQRVDTGVSYVMACGASNKNLQDAEITFPYMNKTDEVKAIDPLVTYDGQALTEGVDYTIVGTVDYTAAGTFTCYVRGIYNYTGLVECIYTVTDVTLTETEDYLYMTLNADCQIMPELTKDLYVDLNGFDLTGTVATNGYKIYGMDSTTDSYTCEAIGYMNLVDENGETVVPVTHLKSDITGATKRYMSIKDDNGYSFHRFYMGITHQTLKPTTTGVGYKALFYGDSMVADNLDSFGFTMTLGNYTPKTFTKTADSFVSGKVITLRIDDYDVENYGETELNASVMLKLTDGTVIETEQCSMTLRSLLETLNNSYTDFTADQLTAIADMIEKYAIIQSWKVENLI